MPITCKESVGAIFDARWRINQSRHVFSTLAKSPEERHGLQRSKHFSFDQFWTAINPSMHTGLLKLFTLIRKRPEAGYRHWNKRGSSNGVLPLRWRMAALDNCLVYPIRHGLRGR